MHKSCWWADNHAAKIYWRRFKDDNIRCARNDERPAAVRRRRGPCIRPAVAVSSSPISNGGQRRLLFATAASASAAAAKPRLQFKMIDGDDQRCARDDCDTCGITFAAGTRARAAGSWIIKFRRRASWCGGHRWQRMSLPPAINFTTANSASASRARRRRRANSLKQSHNLAVLSAVVVAEIVQLRRFQNWKRPFCADLHAFKRLL